MEAALLGGRTPDVDATATNRDILHFMFATSSPRKSLKNVLCRQAGRMAEAALARHRAIEDLTRVRRVESLRHCPRQDLAREVVHHRLKADLRAIDQLDDTGIDMPDLVWSGGADTEGGLVGMDALARPTPAMLTNELRPGCCGGEDLGDALGVAGKGASGMCLCSVANTISLTAATSLPVSWPGLVRGHDERSVRSQDFSARLQAW